MKCLFKSFMLPSFLKDHFDWNTILCLWLFYPSRWNTLFYFLLVSIAALEGLAVSLIVISFWLLSRYSLWVFVCLLLFLFWFGCLVLQFHCSMSTYGFLFICLFVCLCYLGCIESPEFEDSDLSSILSHYFIIYYLFFILLLLSLQNLSEMYIRAYHSSLHVS